MINQTGAPLIETERLTLSLPKVEDLQASFAIVSDSETQRYLGPQPTRPDHFARFLRGVGSWTLYGYGSLMVRLKGSSEPIGTCGIFHSWRGLGEDFDNQPEAGWILMPDHVGQGLAGEAMHAVLSWFDREIGPRRVVALIDPANEPSLRLAAKLGFEIFRDGLMPDAEGSEERLLLLERIKP